MLKCRVLRTTSHRGWCILNNELFYLLRIQNICSKIKARHYTERNARNMYQNVTIVGNVGRDPEMRYTSSGVGVCSFSVAVNRRWTDRQSGEKREKTTWFRVSAWRQLAETCSQYVHKGMLVLVVGEVEADAYIASDGQARASLELNARVVQFLSRQGEGDGSYYDDSDYAAEDVDDIPF